MINSTEVKQKWRLLISINSTDFAVCLTIQFPFSFISLTAVTSFANNEPINLNPTPHRRYNCPRSYTFPNARLRGGLRAGKFSRLGPADDSELCIQRCCNRPSCDLVAWVGDHCYSVSCANAHLCRPVKLPQYTKGMKLFYIAARDGAQDQGRCEVQRKTQTSGYSYLKCYTFRFRLQEN